MAVIIYIYKNIENIEIIDLKLKTLQSGHDFQNQGQMILKI